MSENTRYVGGDDGKVFAVGDSGNAFLGTFEWGTLSPAAADLAKKLCQFALKDEARALKVYRRFFHRSVRNLKPGKPWTMTDEEISLVVRDIERVEVESASERRPESFRPLIDGPTAGYEWTKEPDLKPNR